MSPNPKPQLHLPSLETPSSPRTLRTIRKFQSHQALSSYAQPFSTQPRQNTQRDAVNSRERAEDTLGPVHAPPPATRSHGRTRSNSDVTAGGLGAHVSSRRPARKSGSMGFAGKRSGLDTLLRDGPPGDNIMVGLQELRYLILSSRVDSDGDGMSPLRIYLWLALLNIPPVPTDEYLSLVHRGRSPAYAKIRNDTFRTLATDPLFKRRVTEASLIRLLNAVAWKISDSKGKSVKARGKSQPSPTQLERASTDAIPGSTTENASSPQRNMSSTSSQSTSESAIYVQGMNVLCAPFLYASRSEVEAFALFHYFITQECPGYVRGAMDGVHKGLKLVDKCLDVVEPKLARHLFSKGMYAELYAFPSVLTMCACTPPLPEVLHLWDFLFAYGSHLNILCIVAQLIRMRDTLLASPSPNKILRSLPSLDAKEIIALTVLMVRKLPDSLYEELVTHAK